MTAYPKITQFAQKSSFDLDLHLQVDGLRPTQANFWVNIAA